MVVAVAVPATAAVVSKTVVMGMPEVEAVPMAKGVPVDSAAKVTGNPAAAQSVWNSV